MPGDIAAPATEPVGRPDDRSAAMPAAGQAASEAGCAPFKDAKARAVAEFERSYVREMLARAGGNISQAARLSNQERSAFGKLVRKYRLGGEGQLA